MSQAYCGVEPKSPPLYAVTSKLRPVSCSLQPGSAATPASDSSYISCCRWRLR